MLLFNRFITQHKADYFELSMTERQSYISSNRTLLNQKFTTFFCREVLGKKLTDTQAYLYFKAIDLEPVDNFIFNESIIYLNGVGENYFFLNEFLSSDKTTASYRTLFDFDKESFEFQERYKIKSDEFPNKTEMALHTGHLHSNWARAVTGLVGEPKFHYLILESAASYIGVRLEEYMSYLIEDLIPHETYYGENHMKKTECDNYEFDLRTNAYGLEEELNQLRKFGWQVVRELWDEAQVEFHKWNLKRIWVIENEDESKHQIDPSLCIVFSDVEAMKVRLANWDEDIAKLRDEDLDTLTNSYNCYARSLELKLNEEYERLTSAQ